MRRHTDVLPAPISVVLPRLLGNRPFHRRRAAAIAAAVGFAIFLFILAHVPLLGTGR